jgi:hypothetical protein
VSVINGFVRLAGPSITDLSVLRCLTRITGYRPPAGAEVAELYGLELSNTALTSLEGLEALTEVSGGIRIENNPMLTSLRGLDNLNQASHLVILGNRALETLDGLGALATAGNDLTIVDNAALQSLVGLSSLTAVGRTLTIFNNAALSSLEGVGGLSSAGALYVRDNVSLPTCEALSLRDRLGVDDATIFGNDDAGVCQ